MKALRRTARLMVEMKPVLSRTKGPGQSSSPRATRFESPRSNQPFAMNNRPSPAAKIRYDCPVKIISSRYPD